MISSNVTILIQLIGSIAQILLNDDSIKSNS